MSHMVIFRTPEGKPGYQPAETVKDAVEVVERLRNDDGVENVRIFRLEELSFEYRPYYKVELAGAVPEAGSSRAVFGRPTVDDSSVEDDHIDDGQPVDEVSASADAIESSSDDMPSAQTAEHPPWAAPPPPPPPPAGGPEPFGAPASAEGDTDDDDFSGVGGQRRGLFGR